MNRKFHNGYLLLLHHSLQTVKSILPSLAPVQLMLWCVSAETSMLGAAKGGILADSKK